MTKKPKVPHLYKSRGIWRVIYSLNPKINRRALQYCYIHNYRLKDEITDRWYEFNRER